MACGGTSPLVPVQEEEDGGTQPETEVTLVVIPPVKTLDVELKDVDVGKDLPGNSENTPRCDAGRGKKLGLIKHGKCEPQ